MSPNEERLTGLVRDLHQTFAQYLADLGEPSAAQRTNAELQTRARRVVWAQYYTGEDAWDRLKLAIGELEDLVGRPVRETDI